MDKNAFIKIENNRIKLSNIKSYGISKKHFFPNYFVEDESPIGECRRKIWFTDHIMKKTVKPEWQIMDFFDETFIFDFHEFHEFMNIDDSDEWKNYIDMDVLQDEYNKVKEIAVQKGKEKKKKNKKKNRFTSIFKNAFGTFGDIDEELSSQEAVIPFFDDDLDLINTKGKLYYDGKNLRCIGSPFRGAKLITHSGDYDSSYAQEQKMMCTQYRLYDKESDLIKSGELKKIYYPKKDTEQNAEEIITSRYLYITTYQNDNYKFFEDTCDIDEVLKKLDDALSI